MKEFPLLGRTLGNSILRKNEGGRIVQWERLNCPTAVMGFPGHTSGKEPTCKFWRQKTCRFDPWVRKIPWRRAWQPTPVILAWRIPWTEEPGELQSIGSKEVDRTEAT